MPLFHSHNANPEFENFEGDVGGGFIPQLINNPSTNPIASANPIASSSSSSSSSPGLRDEPLSNPNPPASSSTLDNTTIRRNPATSLSPSPASPYFLVDDPNTGALSKPLSSHVGRKVDAPYTYIPRPPNAFILFRHFMLKELNTEGLERDRQSAFSKIVAMQWKSLSIEERQKWEGKAAVALAEHKIQYPDYDYRHRMVSRSVACDACRRRKMKCDKAKPSCGACLGEGRDVDCTYLDDPTRPIGRVKRLETHISRLETKVRELEQSNQSMPSMASASYYQSQGWSQPSPGSSHDTTYFFSPTPVSSSSPFGSSRGSPHSSRGSPREQGSPSGIDFDPQSAPIEQVPIPAVIHALLEIFLPHSSQFGFFLNISRFRDSALLPSQSDNPLCPSPALSNAVYLWGAYLSQSEPLASLRNIFLVRALKYAATDLASLSAHPQKALHTIQAEVLLSYFFFRNGQFLEAKCHSGLAVSLALGCGLHRIRSSQPIAQPTIGVMLNMTVDLPRPQDGVEEGERINGFWTVFILHKTLAVALDPPSNLCGALEAPDMQIDTPWPLDIERYTEVLPLDLRGSLTVQDFLNESIGNSGDRYSMISLSVKGAILFHRAAHLAGQWTPNMQPQELHVFSAAFASVDRLIDKFRADLPSLSQFDATAHSMTRMIVIVHGLAEAAVIKLHSNYILTDSSSRQKSLAAARAIVRIGGVNIRDFGQVNPIMATLWRIACQVFLDEIGRIRAHQTCVSINDGDDLLAWLRAGMAAMTLFSEGNPLMRYHLSRVQEGMLFFA